MLICIVSSSAYSLQEAKIESKASGKNIFVNYTASWCVPCQIFKEGTLSNSEVKQVLADEFVVINAEWDDRKYLSTFNTYEICCLPTLHILDSKGEVLSEIQSTLPTQAFYNELLKYTRPIALADNTNSMPKEVTSKKSFQKLFTLQAGAFSSHKNAMKQKENIQKVLNENVYIIEDKRRGLYLIQVGDYSTTQSLKPLVKVLNKANIDSFLKSKN